MAFYITKIVDEFYIHAFSRWFNPKRLTKRNKTNANMTALLEYTQKQFNLGVLDKNFRVCRVSYYEDITISKFQWVS